MKRIMSVLLAMVLLVSMTLPAMAESVYSTSYSEQFVMGYSWSTGKSKGTSHAFRVFFKNPAKRSITSYQVSMRFYDADGNLLSTGVSDWVEATVKSGNGKWSPFLEADNQATTFTWKLVYHLNNTEKEYSTKWLTVADPANNSVLAARRAWTGAKKISVTASTDDSTVKATSFQEKYLFNINSTSGKIKGVTRSFRTYFKNISDIDLMGYKVELTCTVPDTEVP